MRSFTRRLPLGVLLFGCAYPGLALALPNPTKHIFSGRAGTEFFTVYGVYDLSPHVDASADGSPRLAPINDVFMAMTTETAESLASPTPTDQPGPSHPSILLGPSTKPPVQPGPSAALTSDPAPTMTSSEVYPIDSPPFHGPGLVILSTTTSAPDSKASPSPTPSGISDAASANENHTSIPSHRMVVLGCVIGSILFFTLCLFFLLDPRFTGRLCGCLRFKKRPKRKQQNDEKQLPHTPSWITVTSSPTVSKHGSIETVKEGNGDTISEVPTKSPPPSKFSFCSSEYPASSASSRVSRVTTDTATSASTVKPSERIAASNPGPSPVRPPRPPTADSPALSDSVYLACSDQPYVIVTPQPLTDADRQSGIVHEPPKKLLTPTEFLALHVLGTLVSNDRDSSRKPERASTYASGSEDRRTSALSTANDMRHSRTKSAPMLGAPSVSTKSQSLSRNSNNLDVDYGNDSDVQEAIVRRVMKHRRSRSASGWAYPNRARSRRAFI